MIFQSFFNWKEDLMCFVLGVTQELIDETRLTNENRMLAELQQRWADGGDLEWRGSNGETPVSS